MLSWRQCAEVIESLDYIIDGCSFIASTDSNESHENVTKIIYVELALKYLDIKNTVQYLLQVSSPVMENEEDILYWDKPILTNHMGQA